MRKLVWCTLGYVSALAAAHYLLPCEYMPWFALVCVLLPLPALLLGSRVKAAAFMFCLSAALGFMWSWGYNAAFIAPAEQLIGKTLEVQARVIEYPKIYNDYSSVELRLTEDWAPDAKFIVYDYEGDFSELVPGDELTLEVKFISAKLRANTESDYYISDGIHLRAYLGNWYEVTGKWDYSFLYAPKYLANSLKTHILELFPQDTAPLMKALLTGDKTEFYDDDRLYSAMKTAGFTHIIAVSGMHVSFILGLLRLWTGRRRMTAVIGIPLVWFFAAMSGFTPSVIRASAMITMMLIAPIIGRENDAPTSLSAAALLLTLLNPESIGSISLQLSFAAMAGIILVTPMIYSSLGRLYKDYKGFFAPALRSVNSVFSASLGAAVFTTPLVALHFGYVPLYSIICNMLCLWAMSTAFMAAYPACIIGAVYFPLGSALCWLIAWLPRFAILVVEFIADLPYAALSARNNYFAWWLIFVYAVLFIPWLFRGKGNFRPVIPICCCVASFLTVTLIVEAGTNKGLEFNALDVGQGQCLLVTADDVSVIIDCGSKSGTDNAGDIASDFLLAQGRQSLDVLILTHLHADHANGVVRLLSRIDVGKLIIPEDCEDTEYRDSIINSCYDNDVEVITISSDTTLSIGDMCFDIFAPIGSNDTNENGLIILGEMDGFEFLVTGDAGQETEQLFASFYDVENLDLLVVGHHGSKYSACDELLDETAPYYAVISVGVNSYGHPSEDVLQRLYERGIEIYRTDLHGNITVRAGT